MNKEEIIEYCLTLKDTYKRSELFRYIKEYL